VAAVTATVTIMMTRGKTRADRTHSSSDRSSRTSDKRGGPDCEPAAEAPEELEPLDEKSLEQVMRECPL
jgi:hypothetical protein